MKPKLRTPQRQTSRLFFRRRDHREFIMDDTYHNGVWMCKRDQKKEGQEEPPLVDELIWWKYPHESLITSTGNLATLGWMDTDRQFQHQISFITGQRYGAIFKFNDFVVAWHAYSSIDYIRVTEDGCIWKAVDLTIRPNVPVQANRYGLNSLCSVSGSTLLLTDFVKNEETERYAIETRTISLPHSDMRFLCSSYNGCYVGRVQQYTTADNATRWQLYIFRVTDDEVTFKHMEENLQFNPFDGRIRECSFGLQSGFVVNGSYRMYWNRDIYYDTFTDVVVGFASANGIDWTVQALLTRLCGFYTRESYGFYNKYDICVRDGTIYVLTCSYEKLTQLYRFTGSDFEEIAIPYWVDVQVLSEGGKGVGMSSWGETVRIGLKPRDDGFGAQVWIYDLMRLTYGGDLTPDLNNGQNNIRVKDGKIADSDEFLMLGVGSVKVYFDNLQFIGSSKSFAYVTASIDATDGAERIQDNDYVLR